MNDLQESSRKFSRTLDIPCARAHTLIMEHTMNANDDRTEALQAWTRTAQSEPQLLRARWTDDELVANVQRDERVNDEAITPADDILDTLYEALGIEACEHCALYGVRNPATHHEHMTEWAGSTYTGLVGLCDDCSDES